MKIIISLFTIVSLITLSFSYVQADEVVFCVSETDNYAVLMDAKGQCLETEDEHAISGSKIKRSENKLPLVHFSENKNCKGDSKGTITKVGFDKSDDGILNQDEILTSSGSCTSVSIASEGEEEIALE